MRINVILAGLWMVYFALEDIQTKSIPIWAFGIAFVTAFVERCMFRTSVDPSSLINVLPGSFVLLLSLLWKGKIGSADGLCTAFLGILAGGEAAGISMVIGSLLFTIYVATGIFLKGWNKEEPIPFLPFLAIGYWMIVLICPAVCLEA